MDLIQKLSLMALLTMVVYFILVNIVDIYSYSPASLPTPGVVTPLAQATAIATGSPVHANIAGVQLEDEPINGKINTALGFHHRTLNTALTGVAPEGDGIPRAMSVYNPNADGVLPSNHSKFETAADFVSDVTNINQFYRNNPDVFKKTSVYVPDATVWGEQSHNLQLNQTYDGPISGYNYNDPKFTPMDLYVAERPTQTQIKL